MRNRKIRLGVFSGLCGEKVIAKGNERTNEKRSASPTTTDVKLQMPDERFGDIGGGLGGTIERWFGRTA